MVLKDTDYPVKYGRPQAANLEKNITVKFGACPHDCPDGCAMLYHVENGRLVKVSGNPYQPFTRGRLCVKTKDFAEHHYNPNRVLYPLRRSGAKGEGKFVRISWDEALDEIYERWQQLINQQGAESILPYGYFGNMGILNGSSAGDAFFNKLGTSIGEKTFCASSAVTAQLMTVGPTLGTDPESIVQAKYIIIWGGNTVTTNSHLWPFIASAQKEGAKVVVIDPYRTRTAEMADWHLAVRPGTDGALALAMINLIIENDWLDEDYVDRYTLGFEELKAAASSFSVERAASITGINAEDIRTLADEYSNTQPALIRVGVGLERYPNGGQAIRAIDCLPALIGAWRYSGGGLLQMPVFVPVRADLLSRPDWIQEGKRVINLTTLAEVLTDKNLAPVVNSLFIWNANPVVQAPNTNKVVEGLLREDLFTVVSEYFITDTARYADLVLPATMAAEHNDIVTSWGQFYIAINQKAIEAPGEAISNFDLFQRLARRFGFNDLHFTKSDTEFLAEALDWDAPLLQGRSYEMLKENGFIRLNVPEKENYTPHAQGNFPTPSGKCEFRSSLDTSSGLVAPLLRQMLVDRQASKPIDSVPNYIPTNQVAAENKGVGAAWPLQLISPKSHAFLNSGYANEEHKLRKQEAQFVLINPVDAVDRNISHGDSVRVLNQLGVLVANARVTDDVPQGVVVATFGYWGGNAKKNAVNALTHYGGLGFAGTPYYNNTRVEVEKLSAAPELP